MLDEGGEVCRAKGGLGPRISHIRERLVGLISRRTMSRMRLYSVS